MRSAGKQPLRRIAADRPAAVLIGIDSMQGLGAARILAKRNVPVIAIAKDGGHDACKTRVCERIIVANTETEELIERLVALGPTLDQRAVLYPCEDASVLLVSRNRDRLAAWYHIKLPPADVIETLMDKAAFYEYANEHGLPIPETFMIRSRADLDAIVDQLSFPCILKPANSATSLWESQVTVSAFRVQDRESLLSLYDSHHHLSDVLIVQRWIPGPDSNLYSCNCYYDDHGIPLATFVARKIRQWPPHIGKSCLGEECRDDTVLEQSLALLGGAGYVGLGYVEIKRDANTGEYFIVEPNVGRPTGRSAIAETGGVELLYTMYCDAVGLPLPTNREQQYRGVKWIHLRHDLQSAIYYRRNEGLTLRDWWRSWRGKKAYALFAWHDPLPFLSDVWRIVRVILSPERRRKWARSGFGEGEQR
jgi:predicted ATP-grasp superfamily ATP-dependent carboligase